MFEPTEEQREAIKEEGTNIIVSAGAGSGKTAVLKERVARKLREGVKINELLILTFTNKAAHEMKDRIRKVISKDETIKDNLSLLDSSYITTFDSFALSIVKKYNYLINVSKSIKVIEPSVMNLKYSEILNEVFDELYEEKNTDFYKLLNDLTDKDDENIKELILSINKRLDLKYYKNDYLDSYLDKNYNDEYINNLVDDYNKLIKDNINKVNDMITIFSNYVDTDYFTSFRETFEPLLNSNNYDEYKKNINYSFKSIPKGTDEEGKELKKQIVSELKDKIDAKLLRFENVEELKETYKSTYPYVNIIVARTADKDNELYKTIVEAYQSATVGEYILNEYEEAFFPQFNYNKSDAVANVKETVNNWVTNSTKTHTVKVGVCGANNKQWDAVQYVLDTEYHDQGIYIETVEYSAYNIPNDSLNAGEIDLNAFQHKAYLANEIKNNGYQIESIGDTLIAPLTLYSKKYNSLKAIKEAAGLNK